MKTTFNLDSELYSKAVQETGVKEKTKLIHMGLEAIIAEGARKRLIAMEGKYPSLKSVDRKKRVF